MKRAIYIILIAVVVLVAATAYCVLSAPFRISEPTYLYIDNDDDIDSVNAKIKQTAHPQQMLGIKLMQKVWKYDAHVRSGRYAITPDMTSLQLIRDLHNAHQAPVQLVIPATRTLADLANALDARLMFSASDLLQSLNDSATCASFGLSEATMPALFVPNTYEIYWNTTVDAFLARMKKEHDAFWTAERQKRAAALGLTPEQATTLASIVDAETSYTPEKPSVAALYLNRLQRNMLLQSDPTVIFAIGDFSIRRVTGQHLRFDSPYNTYLYKGLPPGPIRIASIAGIDAVLNPDSHDYLYMCAKEDFSGSHRFASTFAEHKQNAQRYTAALNARGIH